MGFIYLERSACWPTRTPPRYPEFLKDVSAALLRLEPAPETAARVLAK